MGLVLDLWLRCICFFPMPWVHPPCRSARFYAGAVQLANWGALTRIILSGILLSKF